MTLPQPTLLIPPQTLRADHHVTTWHSGLIQGPRWVALTLMVDPAPEIVSAHRARYDSSAPPEERRRAISLLDAVQAIITRPDTTEEPIALWQGGTQGLDPLATHLFTHHTLTPGRYTLEIKVTKPEGATGTYRHDFQVVNTATT